MIFTSLILSEYGVINAEATGHADEVVTAFRKVSSLLLASRGPWRITDVQGTFPDDAELDSDMKWTLVASQKKQPL